LSNMASEGGWCEIAVPAIVSAETFERVAARLTDNKRFASRNSTSQPPGAILNPLSPP